MFTLPSFVKKQVRVLTQIQILVSKELNKLFWVVKNSVSLGLNKLQSINNIQVFSIKKLKRVNADD